MKRILPVLALAACTSQGPRPLAPDSLELADAAASITAEDMRGRIAFLADDALRGRDTPSEGLETAAAWIADQLAAFGLEPAGDEGWLQRYPYPARQLDTAETHFGVVAGATHFFEYGRDYVARRGREAPEAVGAVYTGSDLPAPAPELRDRAAVLLLDAFPRESRRGLRWSRQTEREVRRLRDAAAEAGAAAIVFVLPVEVGPDAMAALAEREAAPDRELGGEPGPRAIPAFFLARTAALRLFRMAEADASLLDGRPVSRPVPLDGATLRVQAPGGIVDDARPPNVVGVLRGSDPALRDEYVVVSAHMDHVGVGAPDETGDSIYNGADDDASGTAALVEVAEAMARLEHPPARSILFLAVSGEEKGLLGSRWFSEHPTVPLERIVANVNLDMVGRNAPDSIVVIGQEYSTLGATVQDVARAHPGLGLTVSGDLWPEERFFFRSDHFHFVRKEIPALFFFAGTHEDYHRPGDEVDAIDADKAARVGRLAFYLTYAVAADRDRPEWHPEGLREIRRLTAQ